MKQLYIDGNDYFCGMAKRLTYFKSLEKQAEQAGCTATRTRYHVNPAYDADLVENITIENGGKYSNTTFQMKITARTIAQQEDPNFLIVQKHLLSRLGLPDNSIGRQFVSQGKTFQITRIDAKKWKMPVIATHCIGGKPTGRSFKFPEDVVKRYFENHGA